MSVCERVTISTGNLRWILVFFYEWQIRGTEFKIPICWFLIKMVTNNNFFITKNFLVELPCGGRAVGLAKGISNFFDLGPTVRYSLHHDSVCAPSMGTVHTTHPSKVYPFYI